MNITFNDRIQHTLARAELRMQENKSSIRTYKSEIFARSIANKLSDDLAAYWEVDNAPVYVLTLANGRHFVCADLYQITTDTKQGGYIAYGLDGHWTLSPATAVRNVIGEAA